MFQQSEHWNIRYSIVGKYIINSSSVTQKLCMGGQVPQSYYLKVMKPIPKSYMTSLKLSGGSKTKLEYKIIQANSMLK